MLAPLLMLQALMLLLSLPTTIPADAGARFDAEGLDAAYCPTLQLFLLVLTPLLMLMPRCCSRPSLQSILQMLAIY